MSWWILQACSGTQTLILQTLLLRDGSIPLFFLMLGTTTLSMWVKKLKVVFFLTHTLLLIGLRWYCYFSYILFKFLKLVIPKIIPNQVHVLHILCMDLLFVFYLACLVVTTGEWQWKSIHCPSFFGSKKNPNIFLDWGKETYGKSKWYWRYINIQKTIHKYLYNIEN